MADSDGGKVVDCVPANGQPIIVDADIMGSGVIAAFCATAALTIAAIVVAYFTKAVDAMDLNDLDDKIIGLWRHQKWPWTSKRLAHSQLHVSDKVISTADEDNARSKAVLQLILSFSDQQLVTGLAILIAGVLGQNERSGYEFLVITTLAWFSSTTHLATLHALKSYLGTLGLMRHIRVFAMLATLAVLTYTGMAYSYLRDQTMAIICVFRSADFRNHNGPSIGLIIVWAILVLQLIGRITALYEGVTKAVTFRFKQLLWACKHQSRLQQHEYHLLEEAEAEHRLKKLSRLAQSQGLRRQWLLLRMVLDAYAFSFLIRTTGISLMFSSGLAFTASFTGPSDVPVVADTTSWTFGQITACLLVILPFFAMGESFYAYRFEATHSYHTQTAPVPWQVQTYSTRPPHSSGTHDVEIVFQKFKAGIQKYFPKELHHQIEASTDSEDQILARKHDLIKKYRAIHQFEMDNLNATSALCIFAVHLGLAVWTGAEGGFDLNITFDSSFLYYLMLEGIFFGIRLFKTIGEIEMYRRSEARGQGSAVEYKLRVPRVSHDFLLQQIEKYDLAKGKRQSWKSWALGPKITSGPKRTPTVRIEAGSDTTLTFEESGSE